MTRRSLLALTTSVTELFARAQTSWTIMPLGDSITAGGKLFHSYRGSLARMMQRSGLLTHWVGTQSTPEDEPQLKHEGYPGKPIEYLAATSQKLYSANPADIVLLHAGHNHTVEEHPVPGILRSTEQIIRSVRSINPGVTILLAQVIPSGKLPKYAYIPDLNRRLPTLVHQSSTQHSSIVLVNQAADFDPQTDTIEDHVHPNAKGAEKMARTWFDSLRLFLETRRLGFESTSTKR